MAERLTFAGRRWPDDPYPDALEAFTQAAAAQEAAWRAVEREAWREANAARSVRTHFTNGRNLIALVAAAQALAEGVRELHVRARLAEDARPSHSAEAPPPAATDASGSFVPMDQGDLT